MKKIFSVILSIAMMICIVPMNEIISAESYNPNFQHGSGTAEDPFQISNAYQLNLLSELIYTKETSAEYCDKYYIQTADIDLKGKNFIPIGTYSETADYSFRGHYDGNYKKITGLTVEKDSRYNGLFGIISSGGSVKNLSIEGKINCPNTIECGGLAGAICFANIENCSFTGYVSGESVVGGLVGTYWVDGNICNSYFNGTVNASLDAGSAGGIVGNAVVGYEGSVGNITIINCYATGNEIKGSLIGGIIGTNAILNENSLINLTNNYYLDTMAPAAVNGDITGGCLGLPEKTLKEAAELLGSPFINTLNTDVNDGYPIFEWQNISTYKFKGNGTEADPYQISNAYELNVLAEKMNNRFSTGEYNSKYYIQTENIDLEEKDFIPIGTYSETADCSFRGHYNGNCKNITGLKVEKNTTYNGLFGVIASGSVKNLAVYGKINCPDAIECGGLAGAVCFDSIIENCSFTGDILGASGVGGIAGDAWRGGNIQNCYFNGNVEAKADGGNAGGIIGTANVGYQDSVENITVLNCYATGKAAAFQNGGIIGNSTISNEASSIKLSNNYYLKEMADAGANGSVTDGCKGLSEKLLKEGAEFLGSSFINNTDENINGGYPIFEWQLKSQNDNTENAVLGDANNDGKIDVRDVAAISQHIVKIKLLEDECFINADVNKDGNVTITDLTHLKRYLIKDIASL